MEKQLIELKDTLCEELEKFSSYDGGYSYRGGRSGKHYVRGHYSWDDGKNYMRMKLEEMMRETGDENVRSAIRQCVEQIDEV